METTRINCLMSWVSWPSIIAGMMTAFAVSVVMAALGAALGFAIVNPLASDPFAGVGIAFGLWSLLSVLVSLGAGGFVGGFFSGNRGYVHGFLVWATALTIGTIFSVAALGSVMSSLTSTVGSGAASALSVIGDKAADLANHAVQDFEARAGEVTPAGPTAGKRLAVLRDTEIEHFQPQFYWKQLREARSDLSATLAKLQSDTGNFETIIDGFLKKQEQRLESIRNTDVDRNAAIERLMEKRNLSEFDATVLFDDALTSYYDRMERLERVLDDSRQRLDDAKAYLTTVSEQARKQAEAMTETATKSALMAALALLLGAAASIVGGMYGSRYGSRCVVESFRDI